MLQEAMRHAEKLQNTRFVKVAGQLVAIQKLKERKEKLVAIKKLKEKEEKEKVWRKLPHYGMPMTSAEIKDILNEKEKEK